MASAADSDQALERLDGAERFDLLITDVILEGEKGPEVAQRVRSRIPDIAVLYISGYAADALPVSELENASFLGGA